MLVQEDHWKNPEGRRPVSANGVVDKPQRVLSFAAPGILETGDIYVQLRGKYPDAHPAACTTGGEISSHASSGICELHNQTMTVTAFSGD
jgi:hypothetical protein